jgi:hypothetical protein
MQEIGRKNVNKAYVTQLKNGVYHVLSAKQMINENFF